MYNKKIVNWPRITFLSHDFCSPVPVFLKDATGHWSGPSITTRDSSRPAIAASATNDGPPLCHSATLCTASRRWAPVLPVQPSASFAYQSLMLPTKPSLRGVTLHTPQTMIKVFKTRKSKYNFFFFWSWAGEGCNAEILPLSTPLDSFSIFSLLIFV